MVVVTLIGVLAAIAIPAFARVKTKARINRLASDLRTYAQVFETYSLQNGGWPPDAEAGQVPAGLEGQLKGGWTGVTPLGGQFDWDNWPNMKKITIFDAAASEPELRELDRLIDDGNPLTGTFRQVNTHYSLILEETSAP